MWKRLKGSKKRNALTPFSQNEPVSSERLLDSPADLAESAHESSHRTSRTVVSLSKRQSQRPPDGRNDPLGLSVLHTPAERSVDIVFIHGLGGTSLRSWCHDRNLDYLWPQLWLPYELTTARILTFGYNANFMKKEQVSLTIADFANDLLFRMKYGEAGPVRLGQVPIIVVAHSMGGLVFKKAFLQGHTNDEFRGIVSMIKATLFLATPHRGTDLADTLSKILNSSILGRSPKDYVSELARRSPTIDELNDAFRHHASKLKIFSFYETISTQVGPMKILILDKSTSLIGYPNETPEPLNANHHSVCKYTSTEDPNYASVLGALRSLVESLSSQESDDASKEETQLIQEFLGVPGPPEEDVAAGRAMRKPGTCEEFLAKEEMVEWLNSESKNILWVHAPPGNGKSTLCSFVIDHLLGKKYTCAYFVFRHGNLQKQSLANMLRSLAYQMASQIPEFRHALVDLARSGIHVNPTDAITVWKRLYASVLSRIPSEETIHWIIDGIDESDLIKQGVGLLSQVSEFVAPIRILVFSRPLSAISQAFQLARSKISLAEMPLPPSQGDIRLLVSSEIEYLPSSEGMKAEIVDDITSRSQGNFLWASLVVKRVIKCNRQDQVRAVLDSTPEGMDQLYDRMLDQVIKLETAEDKALSEILLSWAMYAESPITVEELSEAHPSELKPVMDFKYTLDEVCGQFVVVNPHNQITLVHHSARQYFKKAARQSSFPFLLSPERVHEELFRRCLVTLCDRNLRSKISTLRPPKLLPYAALSWSYHLGESSPESNRILDALTKFFNGPFPLPWIYYLVMSGHLSKLFGVSRALTVFVKKRRKAVAQKARHISGLSLVEAWAADLTKIATKFGRHLREDPSLIYSCIPPLCPATSVISQKFAHSSFSNLSVTGISNEEWDDCLARVSSGTGRALRLAASSLYLAVSNDVPRGSITLWDTNMFVEQRTFNTGEYIRELSFNDSGSLFACCGDSRTHLWRVGDGSLQSVADNPWEERPLDFKFGTDDSLMMVTDLRRIYKLMPTDEDQNETSWQRQDPTLLEETALPGGMFLSSPSSVALNSDCTQIAVAYRSFPLSIWNLDPPEMVVRLKRRPELCRGPVISHTGTNKMIWHPSDELILGIHGQIFKWSPVDDTYEEAPNDSDVVPNGIQCSPSGQVFITSDVQGTIKIFDVASMSLVYKLTSEDLIRQICFSPEDTRFYDLRGSYCNVWEPSCLLRMADAAVQQTSDTDGMAQSFWSDTDQPQSTSMSFPASESHSDSKPAVSLISSGSKHADPVAYANDRGTIQVYDPIRATNHIIARQIYGMDVQQLAWNRKHDRLAYSLTKGATTVKAIDMCRGPDHDVQITDVYTEKSATVDRGLTLQILFDETGNLIFIHGREKSQVRSLPGWELVGEQDNAGKPPGIWQQHLLMPDLLLCVTEKAAMVFTWELVVQASITLDLAPDPSDSWTIDSLQSHCHRYLLVQTMTLRLNRQHYGFHIFPTETIYSKLDKDSSSDAVRPIELHSDVSDIVSQPVGILPDGQFVFLDKNLWVCTIHLRENDGVVTRRFFLPHDWVTSSGIRLCQVLKDGTFLCPRKGEVAIIQSDLIANW